MINRTKAAKQAISEADDRVEGSFTASDVNRAENYVDQALDILYEESGGYDPETLAPSHARSAVVEFAKARLLGQEPQNAASYRQAAARWAKTAAAKYHNQGHSID